MTNNSKLLDESSKSAWNDSYRLSKAQNLWGALSVPYIANALKLFQDNSCISLIDIPCGDGRNMAPLMSGVPFVIGMDSSKNALCISDSILRHQNFKNYILLEGDIFDTRFQDKQFCGVFCWDILGHLRNPHIALVELRRICKDDGIVVASFFSHGDSTKGIDMVSIGNNEFIFSKNFYFRFFDDNEVINLVEECGFKVMQIDLVTWSEPPHEGYRNYKHEHQSWAVALKKSR